MEVLKRVVMLTIHDYVYTRAKQNKMKTQQGKEMINAKMGRTSIINKE